MSATLVLLSGVTASTTGPAFELPVVGREVSFNFAYVAPGGSGSVSIQVSFDGNFWFPSGATLVANDVPNSLSYPVRFVRAVYDDGGHTGSITVQALQSDEDD